MLQDVLGVEALSAGAWYVAIDLQLHAMALALLWHGLAPAGAGLFERHHPGALGIGAALAGAGAERP